MSNQEVGLSTAKLTENDRCCDVEDWPDADGLDCCRLLETPSGMAVGCRAAQLSPTWLGDYYLGVANVEARRPHKAEPLLVGCQQRRYRAADLFASQQPTRRYFAPIV